MADDVIFLHAFASMPGIGPMRIRALKHHFGTFQNAWRQSSQELIRVIGPSLEESLVSRSSIDPEKEFLRMEREHIWMMAEPDPDFPELLQHIPQPPFVLYGRGARLAKDTCGIAIVGTRRPTAYGLRVAEQFTRELSAAGVAIISGMAVGIDTLAHVHSFAGAGKTIAVLGSGIDEGVLFPQQNRRLAENIVKEGGSIISEYAPGTSARIHHFPARNRIVAGLSRAILIIEARERSGALITARFGAEQGRDVFAIPGSIFSPTSAGTNLLLAQGAAPALSAESILEALGITHTSKEKNVRHAHSEEEQRLLQMLDTERSVDDLKQMTGMKTPSIISALSLLELKGVVRSLGGDIYQKI